MAARKNKTSPRAAKAELSLSDYLQKILTARVYDVAVETALEPAKALSRRLHNKVLFKREDQQSVRSFKLRGAYNKMVQLTPAQLRQGVICASAGNHAQGVALGAHKLGARAVIVMPVTTPQVKVDAVKSFGGVWRAVHHQRVAAAGFGKKSHAGAGAAATGPADCAFHVLLLLLRQFCQRGR